MFRGASRILRAAVQTPAGKPTPALGDKVVGKIDFLVRERPKWQPHENLLKVTDEKRLELYLKSHIRKLGWLRSKISQERKSSPLRKHFRVNIARHVKMITWVEDKLHEMRGTKRYPKLLPENMPTHTHENPSIQSIVVTHRVPRAYDYPGKEIYEPLVEKDNQRAKETHEAYHKGYANI